MRRLPLLLLVLAPLPSYAQGTDSPITRSLYVAIGGDPSLRRSGDEPRMAASFGVEQSRLGSRWAIRLGADYLWKSSYSATRTEEISAGLTARYGRRSGVVRPYVLGGIGIADLRRRGRYLKYELEDGVIIGVPDTAISATSRWNGMLTQGLGTTFAIGRVHLFTEARLNLYPARLSDRKPYRSLEASKALLLGVRF